MADLIVIQDDKLKMNEAQKLALGNLLSAQGVSGTGETWTQVGGEWLYDAPSKRELVIAKVAVEALSP